MNEMIKQLELFEQQVQKESIPKWIKARLNGLVKQFKVTESNIIHWIEQHKLTLLELELAIDDLDKEHLIRILKELLKETNNMSHLL